MAEDWPQILNRRDLGTKYSARPPATGTIGTGTFVSRPYCSELQVEQAGRTGAGTDLTSDRPKAKPKAKRSQKERLKRQLARLRESTEDPPASVSDPHRGKGAGKGKDRGAKRDAQGRFVTDRQGKPICFGFNNGDCKGVCPKNMMHICQICMGPHPAKACRKGAGA